MYIYKKYLIKFNFFFTAIFLAGCQSITTLPDGQQSVMSAELNSQRVSLKINPIQHNQKLRYTPQKNCHYKESRYTYSSNGAESYAINLTIKPIKEKYLVVIERNNSEKPSTALINPNGRILDFNLADPSDGTRFTTENYKDTVSEKERQLKEKVGHMSTPKTIHFLNPISVFMPEFINSTHIIPNTIVAKVTSDDGSVWGNYVYQGVSIFNGKQVLVMDLKRKLETFPNKEPVIVGFNLMDVSTKLPIYTALDSGSKIIIEYINCND